MRRHRLLEDSCFVEEKVRLYLMETVQLPFGVEEDFHLL